MKTKLFYALTVFCLFLMPNLILGQAPTLGTTSNFVLFTSSGAVTNTGLSQITGNVGTNSATSTGFGNVNGQMHDGDGVSATCKTDLLTLYNQLDTFTPTVYHSTSLGGGDTFVAGVYYMAAATTLNGNLILDAKNNANAVFILQVEGSLSSGASSKVILINGAQACKVFWKAEGLVSLATGTSMKGTIVANVGAITLSTGVTLEGRALTNVGAVGVSGVLAYTPIGCGSPVLLGPTAPSLRSTICYALFSKSGSVTNAGTSYVTGDIGTNVGTTTGFDTLNVTGKVHPIPDISTGTAASDVDSIYAYLNTLAYDIQLLYPAQFGKNLVLTPHTYLLNAATALTDTVYLNGGGEADAVFVIKIVGAFSTSTYSKVILTNGTQAKNVYWLINGAVTINDYSIFRGTFLANNGAVVLKTGVTLDGRALLTVGTLNTLAITAIMPPGCTTLTTLAITSEPINQTVCAGDSAIFTVTATGDSLTYQWRKGTVNLTNTGNISGVTTNRLKIYPANISDTASNYNVIVSGASSQKDTSINVSLKINSLPLIITEPTNKTVCAGDSVLFTVSATGTALTYQWRKGTVNLTNTGNISGATSDSLIINPVSISDTANNYNVIVSGTCSPKDTSKNVSLSVNSASVITTEPSNQAVCAGDSAVFTVTATGTALTYQWRKGTVNLTNTGNISGVTTASLKINPVSISDTANNYNVIVSGTCSPKDTSKNVSLKVNTAPIITIEPTNQSACSGDSIQFTVTATGTNLTYQWRNDTLNLVNGGSISGATTATLTINPVYLIDDSSNYNVIVSGSCSPNDTSKNVMLSINTAPVVITPPVSKTICVGDSVSFTVVATGTGITYQWRKDTINLVDGGNISGAKTATLTIDPVTISDTSSLYNVVISGACAISNTTSSFVNLKSAGDFGVLASTAITSTGFTVINGMDVGISPGVRSSITGFPPAKVINGAIYASDDIAPAGVAAMLTQAKQDLKDAYLYAEGATAPAPATVAGDQGGKTLAPGIYKSTSTLLIQSGDLTLDAQGDANAFWIFQIASDFTTIGGAGGNVILSGGAQAKNITWQVGSSATIGNGTSFKGNILALTSITMNTGSSIDGRLLARNGAVVFSGTNIMNNPSDTTSVPPIYTSLNVSLTVNLLPIITSEPTNKTVCEGDSASFSVTSTGTALTYQWRKGTVNLTNTGNISGAMTATLNINPVSVSDSGNYNVIVSGTCSPKDTSVSVSLTVNTAPIITSEPTNLTVCASSSASFSVSATGTALTYQWRKGTVDLVNAGTISGATSSTLTINPVSISDAGNYNVIVSGTCSPKDTSVSVSLTVNSLPVITSEPTNQVICAGSSVNFTVVATGTALTYQWRKGTVDLVNAGTISGATSSTLTINPVVVSDAGNYNVIISGTCSPKDTSISVSLTVDIAPVITSEPTNLTVCASSSASFSVSAIGTALTYQWRKGTVDLVNAGTISGATSSTLTINPVSISDAGNYNVIVSGTCSPKDTSVSVSLTVNSLPVITSEPTNQVICAGSSVNFTVVATGTALTYQWRKGTVDLTNSGTISGTTSSTLTINPVVVSDAGNYNVIISGTCSPKDTSISVSLTVDTAPIITSEPTNLTVCASNSASFSVSATGTALTYQWRKGTVDLVNAGTISGATSSTLTINPVSIVDAGSYNVIVRGTCSPSDTSISVTLNVNIAPVIISQPSNQIVCAGGSVNFSVIAAGTALTYQWRKGLVDLTDGGNISGATTSVLTINPVNIGDAGIDYNVVVSGTCFPNEISNNVSLVVNTSPVILLQPFNQVICEGSSVSIAVVASGTGLNYQWRKGLVDLTDGGNISGATTSILTINPVSVADTGTDYYVIVSGTCLPPVNSAFVTIDVNTAPKVSIQPVNQTVCEGDPVSFTVVASGTNLTYQWNRGIVGLTNGGNISGATSSTLTIYSASLSDAGSDYNVTISGTCLPNYTSPNVTLTVEEAPVITVEPVDQTACTGIEAKFFVVATGAGLKYQWRRDTINLVDGGNISGAQTSTLVIYPVDQNDSAANYNVVITGNCSPSATSNYVALDINMSEVNELAIDGNTITIYPNPFTTSINFVIDNASGVNFYELRIYNVLGEEVINSIINKQTTTIETNKLLSGVYIYKIISNNKTIESGKLISQLK